MERQQVAGLVGLAVLIAITWIVCMLDDGDEGVTADDGGETADEPVPVLSPDLVPPDTTVDAANGVTYTVAEIQAIRSQFTADEWKALVQVAAKHHAPPVKADEKANEKEAQS